MRLKFISLNIWIGGILFDEIVKFLRQEKPDIVALQEVYNSQSFSLESRYHSYLTLSDELDFPHAAFAPAFIETVDEYKLDQGNAILSRFPLTPQLTTFFDIPYGERINERSRFAETPRSLQHAVAHLPETDLHLFNTQGIWGEDGEDNERRLAMSQTIIDQVSQVDPVILAGDFNVRPETQTIAKIENTLHNVFKNELTTTFNMKQKNDPGYASSVVDMVFVSPSINVKNKRCPHVDISDHLPLVVELEL